MGTTCANCGGALVQTGDLWMHDDGRGTSTLACPLKAEPYDGAADQRTAGGMNVTTWLCGSPPANGQYQRYPGRFMFNVRRTYPEFVADDTLHMFAGSSEFGVTTDLRAETGADIVAPFDAIPRPDGSFANALCDPPYADHWQGQWHGDLPKPKHILREAARLVRPGGLIGILHIIVIPAYRELNVERVALHPVLAGPNNAIRVFNVLRRMPPGHIYDGPCRCRVCSVGCFS